MGSLAGRSLSNPVDTKNNMVKQTIQGKVVEFYDDPDDMPVKRWQRYNKYSMISGDMGSSIDDLVASVKKIADVIREDTETGMMLLENMVTSMRMIDSENVPKIFALAALVKSIDGEPREDLSDTGLAETAKVLSLATVKAIDDLLLSIKKKIDSTLHALFPKQFPETTNKKQVYFDALKELKLAQCAALEKGVTDNDEIRKLKARLALIYKPHCYVGEKAYDLVYDRQFNKEMTMLRHTLNIDTEKLTVVGYFSAWDYAKSIAPKQGQKRG